MIQRTKYEIGSAGSKVLKNTFDKDKELKPNDKYD